MKSVIIVLLSLLVFSCSLFKDESPVPLTLADKLERSLYDIPESLQGGTSSQSPASSLKVGTSYQAIENSINPGDVYRLITVYMDYADNIRELLELLISSVLLQNLSLFTEDIVYVVPSDEGGTIGFCLVSDVDFAYKIYLYQDPVQNLSSQTLSSGETIALDQCITQANLIIQFNENLNGLDGEAWFSFTDTDEQSLDTDISIFTDFTNNGTDGGLAIQVFLSPLYNETNISSHTQAIQDDYHFKPTRIFLNMNKIGSTIELSGCSYHPDWGLVSDWLLPEPDLRSIYIYTAIAQSGVGAKVNLALPLNSLNGSASNWEDTMWQQDNLGSRWQEMVRIEVNSILSDLTDTDDATGTDYDGDVNDADFQRYMAASLITMIRGSSIEEAAAFLANQSNFTQAQYDAAKAFWAISGYSDAMLWFNEIDAAAVTLLTTQANVINSTTYRDGLTMEQWDWVYLLVRAQDLIDEAVSLGFSIPAANAADIVNYAVNADPADPWAAGLYAAIEPVLYMINPAFFSDSEGFIGTWNSQTGIDLFYGLDTNTTLMPASFTSLKDLDLSQINPFIPSVVISSTFTIPDTAAAP